MVVMGQRCEVRIRPATKQWFAVVVVVGLILLRVCG